LPGWSSAGRAFFIGNITRVIGCDSCHSPTMRFLASSLQRRVRGRCGFTHIVILTDETYEIVLIWTICVLLFLCGVVALTQHSQWFA
jgi:hypothetical protein